MDWKTVKLGLESKEGVVLENIKENFNDEVYIEVSPENFRKTCLYLHKTFFSPAAMLFATDERLFQKAGFRIWCVFIHARFKKWFFVNTLLSADNPGFDCLSSNMQSAVLFEREIKEMFGIEPKGAPDLRRVHLHEEIWPEGLYPLRKDFQAQTPPVMPNASKFSSYRFTEGRGEGIFEVPVGPVHAGIIGPGHFRFTVAGEPIINLEIRLGFSHRGAEKLFEGRQMDAVALAECVSGDSCFAHSLSFCRALEKIFKIEPPERSEFLRAIFLELERLYNHIADIGGIAIDTGFSFPASLAAIIKESVQRLNQTLTESRFLKHINTVGGVNKDISAEIKDKTLLSLDTVLKDFYSLVNMLNSSVSFMDRVDGTGVLKKKTAEDLGVSGLAGRACGIQQDLRRHFFSVFYERFGFKTAQESSGDCLSRIRVRIFEFEQSIRLIRELLINIPSGEIRAKKCIPHAGYALGYTESWRGPVLYWIRTTDDGAIDRCKIVDASFLNWQGLSYCVLGDIIPDFPLCNKSFDLSYAGSDL